MLIVCGYLSGDLVLQQSDCHLSVDFIGRWPKAGVLLTEDNL